MSARLLLVSADAAIARSVKAALESAASLLQIDNFSGDAGAKFQPSGIIIDSDARKGVQSVFERIAEARRQFPSIPVIAMGNEMSAQLVLAAMRAGADDFVDREAAPEELQAVIRSRLMKNSAPHAGRAAVAGILSGLGGEQDQDFALNLAVRAASHAPGGMTLYIDLALPVSQAGIGLNLDLKFTITDAVREMARLDRPFLESALARCPRSGLHVLALSGDFRQEAQALDAAGFMALLQILQTIFDTIVIGYGPFSCQRALLDISGAQFFLCCNQRFSSIRGAGEVLCWLAENALAQPKLVIHELAPGQAPAPADIRKALEIASSIDIEARWDELAAHLNDAAPLALGGSARYARGLDACLARLGIAPQRPAQKSWTQWLHLSPAPSGAKVS